MQFQRASRSTPRKSIVDGFPKKLIEESVRSSPPPVCDADESEGECTQGQTILSSTEESSEDSGDDEMEFRQHVKTMLKIHGVSTTQQFFDIEKKKILAKEPPSKKRKLK
nr:hypothetical protein [Crucivirus sp.]